MSGELRDGVELYEFTCPYCCKVFESQDRLDSHISFWKIIVARKELEREQSGISL